jgi:hypothetical protein
MFAPHFDPQHVERQRAVPETDTLETAIDVEALVEHLHACYDEALAKHNTEACSAYLHAAAKTLQTQAAITQLVLNTDEGDDDDQT